MSLDAIYATLSAGRYVAYRYSGYTLCPHCHHAYLEDAEEEPTGLVHLSEAGLSRCETCGIVVALSEAGDMDSALRSWPWVHDEGEWCRSIDYRGPFRPWTRGDERDAAADSELNEQR